MPSTTVVFYRRRTARYRFWSGSMGRRPRYRTSAGSRFRGCRNWVTTCPPEADLLRDGIYELRVGLHHVNYEFLYFFHGRVAASSRARANERGQGSGEAIETALVRKRRYEQDPKLHTLRSRELNLDEE